MAALCAIALTVLLVAIGLAGPRFLTAIGDAARFLPARPGSAGVLAGREAFERVSVTDRAGWRLAGEFDGEPGDELALVDDEGVRLVTPSTLAERTQLPLGVDVARKWDAATALVRSEGRLVIVDTGNGFEDTRVRDLDGTERWRYRSDTDAPPQSLVPADLDGDGHTEFYAAIAQAVVRLDGEGQEVWRAPFSSSAIVATAPRTSRDVAWIVATGQGQAGIWNDSGARLASLVLKDARPLGVLDWPDGRFLLAGGSALRAIRLDGSVAFEWRVPDMGVTEALPVSLAAGRPPAIALVAHGARDGSRWRLQLVSVDKNLLYDEVVDAPPQLLRTRGADGADRLFVNSASILVALRPVSR